GHFFASVTDAANLHRSGLFRAAVPVYCEVDDLRAYLGALPTMWRRSHENTCLAFHVCVGPERGGFAGIGRLFASDPG
ncbi:MAG TPA: hypothetical protein PK286_02655, partial [Devosia sp.]|nr:hypothetical protein [Devosia sp.]